jgi:hypothetical protein
MINRIELIPVTKDSYPFASAEKYCGLSNLGYTETEYYMYGTANVYRTADENGGVEVKYPNAPYINRFIIRAPKDPKASSGNVIIEIINPTSFMEIDRMWILGRREFIRNGDIYVGITSKPNTIAKLLEFNKERYGKMSWANPTPDEPFPFTEKDTQKAGRLPDLNSSYEPGLFWDMLTDLAWTLRGNDMNPLKDYPRDYLYLTGWSQSACYMFRYLNSFAYRSDVAGDGCVFDGYLSGGGVHYLVIPVNQYESMREYSENMKRVMYSPRPFIAVQTESENGLMGGWQNKVPDSDSPNLRYRLYEVTGSSHDTISSYVDYYQNDPDLIRINHLPAYIGKHKEGNVYPLDILFAAAYRKLFVWVRTGVSPMHCESIPVDADGENLKDAFGNTRGGLRTCLLNYPSGR